MFKFITMIICIMIGFYAGRATAFELPFEEMFDVEEIQQPVSYETLTDQDIIAMIRDLRSQEDSFEKFSKISALLTILRNRSVIS